MPSCVAAERSLAIVHAMEGRTDAAILELSTLLDANPRDAQTAVALSRLEADSGDRAAADRHLAWATILGFDAASRPAANGTEVLAARQVGTSGHAPNYPWMVYLRRAPLTLTPPDWLVIGADVAGP